MKNKTKFQRLKSDIDSGLMWGHFGGAMLFLAYTLLWALIELCKADLWAIYQGDDDPVISAIIPGCFFGTLAVVHLGIKFQPGPELKASTPESKLFLVPVLFYAIFAIGLFHSSHATMVNKALTVNVITMASGIAILVCYVLNAYLGIRLWWDSLPAYRS